MSETQFFSSPLKKLARHRSNSALLSWVVELVISAQLDVAALPECEQRTGIYLRVLVLQCGIGTDLSMRYLDF